VDASNTPVAALAARSAVMGAFLNVRINAGGVEDKAWLDNILKPGEETREKTIAAEREILDIVESRL
jgi:glutamate formiminotransferase/formiminotetrahydrofolate cyclodeaminase